MSEYRVAQVLVVFALPKAIRKRILEHNSDALIPTALAYIHWFTPFGRRPEANHGMYSVKHSLVAGQREASIIPVANLYRSVSLIPKYPLEVPDDWTCHNVLDKCNTFFVNVFTDPHTYMTIH